MKYKRYVIILIISILIVIFCIWQNNDIVVTEYEYKADKIGETLDGYKIAHISDLHNKQFGKQQKNLLKILEKAKPNIIVVTGDLVDSSKTDIDIALEFIEGAIKVAPIYYVTGNHEYMISINDRMELLQRMEQMGVILLNNKAINVEVEEENDFAIIGLEDTNLADNTLMMLCSSLPSVQLKIVLAHEPQYINLYSKAEADLVLTGHAHGGQFRLPLLGGLVAPNQGFFPKYTSGSHNVNNTTMIISRGLGNSIIPIRIFNRPEVVIVTLNKS